MALAAVVAGALLTGGHDPLSAQQRVPARRWEPRGFDFTPDGVWRRRAREVARLRREALARGDFRLLNEALRVARTGRRDAAAAWLAPTSLSATPALTGIMRVPALLVRYSTTDTTTLRPAAAYDSVLFTAQPLTGRPYTLRTYYEELSNGLFSVQGQAVGWLTLPNSEAYYAGAGSCDGLGGCANIPQLIATAVAQATPSLDWTQFDADGDGQVDLLVLIHPTIGAECGEDGHIWAHRWSYSNATNGSPLETTQSAPSGGVMRVDDYIIQGGVGGALCDAGAIMAPGVVAHEFGHGIGLPDFYDTNPFDGDDSEGIGEWGLLGSGNWARPLSPAHMEAFSLSQLGWITLRPITANGSYTLGPVQTADTAFLVRPPAGIGNPRGEYFLLENRQAVLSDTALIARRGGTGGLLIWHVDSAKYNSSAFFSNTVNSGTIHALWLREADGIGNLRSSTLGIRNRGDAGDVFPGSTNNRALGLRSNPSATLNAAGRPYAGFVIDSIAQTVPNGEMRMRIRFPGVTIVRASDTAAAVRVRGTVFAVYRDVFEDGDTVTIAIDSVQLANAGRTQYVFEGWSDLGARSHTAVATFAGTTFVAAVQARHRVAVTTSGSGSVTLSMPGDLAAGVFVDAGTGVTVTAAPQADQTFIGWSGDTTAITPALPLPMFRPYTLVAAFAPLANVLRAFLGESALISSDQVLALDRNGNNNGALDVGDLAAWLDGTGQPAAAARARPSVRLFP